MSIHCLLCGEKEMEKGDAWARITLDDYFLSYMNHEGHQFYVHTLPKHDVGIAHISCISKMFNMAQKKLLKDGWVIDFNYLKEFAKHLNAVNKACLDLGDG